MIDRNERLYILISILDTNEIRKSNVIAVTLPLDIPFKGPIPDQYFPYIIIGNEAAPTDARLESRSTVLCTIEEWFFLKKRLFIGYRSNWNNYTKNENLNIIDVAFFFEGTYCCLENSIKIVEILRDVRKYPVEIKSDR
jgi:hypothetical protein